MKNKILVLLLIIVILCATALILMKYEVIKFDTNTKQTEEEPQPIKTVAEDKQEEKEVKKVKTWFGNSRSVAVVIDNVGDALPQAGINDAAIVYEVTVEGGLTRLLAVYKDVKDKNASIGPVRSARPVFIDYALENDSIFTHFGYSEKAKAEIAQLKINNINGLVADSVFTRTKEKTAPHNAITTMEKILNYAKNQGYRMTSERKSVLNYVVDEVSLENGETATTVNIPYTSTNKVSFKYNEEKQLYERYLNNKVQKDWITNETRVTKNIIITFARNYTTNEDNGYGRQQIVNIGNLNGYYITNGKAIKITCSKTTRDSQTVYKDESGKEIEVNDGNTYIQIVPIDTKVTFE